MASSVDQQVALDALLAAGWRQLVDQEDHHCLAEFSAYADLHGDHVVLSYEDEVDEVYTYAEVRAGLSETYCHPAARTLREALVAHHDHNQAGA